MTQTELEDTDEDGMVGISPSYILYTDMKLLSLIIIWPLYSANILAQVSTESFIDDSLLIPSQLAVVDDWLFVKSEMTVHGVRAYDLQSGNYMYEFAPKGRGPAEYLNFSIQRGPKGEVLEISDTVNKKNELIDVACLKKRPPIELVYKCILSSVPNRASRQALIINDDFILNHGSNADGVVYLSRGEDVHEYLVKTPSKIKDTYERAIHQALSQTGTITATTDRMHFAYFADSYDKAVFFKYDTNGVQVLRTLQSSFMPEFEVVEIGSSSLMEQSKSYRAAFTWSTSGASFYYALYSGKKMMDIPSDSDANRVAFTSRVQQFDLKGELKRDFEIDRELFNIAADEHDRFLYGIEYDTGGNFQIARFAVPEINRD